jgi:hypothetical protein
MLWLHAVAMAELEHAVVGGRPRRHNALYLRRDTLSKDYRFIVRYRYEDIL